MATPMKTVSSCGKMIEFMMAIGKLKHLRRTGWVLHGVPEPETVASHMYRMAVMAMFLDTDNATPSNVNKDRCIKMALVHDLAECIVGDITPSDGISKDDKHKQEKEAMEHLCSHIPSRISDEIYSLWQEYEMQKTPESSFVKDLDKFDMILQAYEYEQAQGKPHSLQEFYDSTKDKFQTDQIKEWADQLIKMRDESSKEDTS